MAGWTQVPGGQVVYHNGELVTDGGELVTHADQGGWLAFQTAKTAAVGAWAQDATWDASLTEDLEGSAGWAQDTTWEASGLHAEPITAEATFEQTATWSAEALQAEAQDVTASAEWAQDASWAAEGQAAVEEPAPEPSTGYNGGVSIRRYTPPRTQPKPIVKPLVLAVASFSQTAAWDMDLSVDRTPADIDELLLVGAI